MTRPSKTLPGRDSPSGTKLAAFLSGEGEMAALMRAEDWSATPLGLPETWPRSLRMIVGLMLANRFPMLLWWGPDYLTLYNDPYRPGLGDKHPGSLGQPGRGAGRKSGTS